MQGRGVKSVQRFN